MPDESRKQSAEQIARALHGAWDLVEWSEQRADGSKAYPLGEDAIGQIVYTPDGHMAAQLVRIGRQRFASDDWRAADETEAGRAFKEYFGYFGTFEIDVERSVVIHRIKGSWFPNLEGGDQERHFRFEGDSLVLDADTTWGRVRIVWRPAKA